MAKAAIVTIDNELRLVDSDIYVSYSRFVAVILSFKGVVANSAKLTAA